MAFLPKTVLAGLAVVVATGIVTSAFVFSDPSMAEETVAVPVMNVGDTYEYLVHYDADSDATTPDWTPYWTQTISIGAVDEALDRKGRMVPSVEIASTLSSGEDAYHDLHRVSLEDRFVVQTLYDDRLADPFSNSSAADFTRHVSSIVPGLTLQGAALAAGQVVTMPAFFETYPGSGAGGGGGAFRLTWMDLTLTTWAPWRSHVGFQPHLQPERPVMVAGQVVAMEAVDGNDVAHVRWSYVESFGKRVYERPTQQGVPGGSITTKIESWWRSGSPVPIAYEHHRHTRYDNLTEDYGAWRYELTSFQAGSDPVAWDLPPSAIPSWEMAPSGAWHPADGDGSLLPYPLSTAIDDALSSVTDPDWVLWRTQNGQRTLVAAEMSHGALSWTGQPTYEWRLYFATPFSAYEVRTERHPGVVAPVVEGMGEQDVSRPRFAEKAPELLTIAEAEGLWRIALGHPDDAVPSYIHWGVWPESWHSSWSCLWGVSSHGEGGPPAEHAIVTLQIGETMSGPCHTTETRGHHEFLQIRLDHPALAFQQSFDLEY